MNPTLWSFYDKKHSQKELYIGSVQFSRSVVSNSLGPQGLQCTRSPCPSPTPRVHSNSCHELLKLIESVMYSNDLILCCPLLLLPSTFPNIRVFSSESVLRMRWPKYWSFSFSISPSNEYSGWFPLGWTGCISLQSKGLSRVFSNTIVQKHQFFGAQLSYSPTPTSIHDYWKTIALTRQTFVGKVMSLLFNMLSRLVITFLSGSKRLLISWLQSPSAVILEPPKMKSVILGYM